MAKMTLKDLELKDKTVLMRADFNVPQDANLNITDDNRIRATLPSITYILEHGAKKLVLMSHLGRPDGKPVAKYSLKPVAERLAALTGTKVCFVPECVGESVQKAVSGASEKIVLLENLRYHAEEEANDPNFAKALASLGDIYVNDAFGTAHRAHASTEGVAHYLTSAAGLLLEKEIKYLGDAVENPAKPYMIILGGSKVSDKIKLIENLLPKCDAILIGGGMAYTFLKAKGVEIGNSKLEKDKVDYAKGLLDKAAQLHKEILLPVDNVAVETVDANAKTELVGEAVPAGKIGVDIGPKSIALFKQKLSSAKTVVWNGPVGIFEMDAFAQGTKALMDFLSTLKGVNTIIGGGDTAAAAAKFKVEDKMTHISTGGGASLELLEGKVLPGIAALTER
jgi:3-phosphoglycerate kinase